MRRRRQSRVELNFDGLTDSVTNLVGSLILLVVMVIAVTRPKQTGVTSLPPPDHTAGAQKAIDPLLADIRLIKEKIRGVNGDIQRMEQRIPLLDEEVRQLKAKTGGGE